MIVTLEDLTHLEKAFDEFLVIENTLSDDFKGVFLVGIGACISTSSVEMQGSTEMLKFAVRLREYADSLPE